MRNNVIDLIIYLIKRMHIGVRLKDIRVEKLKGYNKSEISAAYSWLIQKYESDDLTNQNNNPRNIPPPRVLHPTERSQIAPEAYGYLLDLYYLGIIDASRMERLIEYAMFSVDNRIETSDVKEWVAGMIFENEHTGNKRSSLLKGNETIN
ncbi:MAG: DUF494 family protein [Balneolales bacterium]